MTTVHVGLDRGDTDVREAEHWACDLLGSFGPGVVACTHLLRVPVPHVAISIALPDALTGRRAALPPVPPDFADAATLAVEEHTSRLGGRAFAFPGREACVGALTVEELIDRSAIERVAVLGGPPPALETIVETRDHVRPQWMSGALTLVTVPAPAGRIAPFELPVETPCCALHA